VSEQGGRMLLADGTLADFSTELSNNQSGFEMPFDEAMTVYVTSIYFATTTMTTVGYGDISAKDNMYE
jgi:voltage-gated potassium channel Kch